MSADIPRTALTVMIRKGNDYDVSPSRTENEFERITGPFRAVQGGWDSMNAPIPNNLKVENWFVKDLILRIIHVEFGTGGLAGTGYPFVFNKQGFSIGVKHPSGWFIGDTYTNTDGPFALMLVWPVGTDLTGATPLIMTYDPDDPCIGAVDYNYVNVVGGTQTIPFSG